MTFLIRQRMRGNVWLRGAIRARQSVLFELRHCDAHDGKCTTNYFVNSQYMGGNVLLRGAVSRFAAPFIRFHERQVH